MFTVKCLFVMNVSAITCVASYHLYHFSLGIFLKIILKNKYTILPQIVNVVNAGISDCSETA